MRSFGKRGLGQVVPMPTAAAMESPVRLPALLRPEADLPLPGAPQAWCRPPRSPGWTGAEEPERSNVIDLMSALKRSLGDAPAKPKKKPTAAKPKAKPTAKRRSA